jgi:hypothetical protein
MSALRFVCTVIVAYAVSFGTANAIVPSFDSTDLKWLSKYILNQDPAPDELISRTYDRYRKIFHDQSGLCEDIEMSVWPATGSISFNADCAEKIADALKKHMQANIVIASGRPLYFNNLNYVPVIAQMIAEIVARSKLHLD